MSLSVNDFAGLGRFQTWGPDPLVTGNGCFGGSSPTIVVQGCCPDGRQVIRKRGPRLIRKPRVQPPQVQPQPQPPQVQPQPQPPQVQPQPQPPQVQFELPDIQPASSLVAASGPAPAGLDYPVGRVDFAFDAPGTSAAVEGNEALYQFERVRQAQLLNPGAPIVPQPTVQPNASPLAVSRPLPIEVNASAPITRALVPKVGGTIGPDPYAGLAGSRQEHGMYHHGMGQAGPTSQGTYEALVQSGLFTGTSTRGARSEAGGLYDVQTLMALPQFQLKPTGGGAGTAVPMELQAPGSYKATSVPFELERQTAARYRGDLQPLALIGERF